MVYLYEAAVYPIYDPLVRRVELTGLSEAQVTTATTLYVPALGCAEPDPEMAARLAALLES
jgi:hypothetical protein